ncbi:hypothetical protein BKA64DRAFT_736571 [Cadophora sp. MPI-SDFR-AT-0126]|nr:hypothetical protein BKA64DRAFT_736571 [Leotiomycetes sp. MPI-SDFR-AT-0126]
MVVGSRGDVQPFIALGQELLACGHQVRIATHNTFRDFVTKANLGFYPIGGDPTDLMAYMVKNPGIFPKFASIRAGDIPRKRKMIAEMLEGCWQSCIQPDPMTNTPFIAEAIIGNPPSFAPIHGAQALGIPVHLMFTMPWSATRAFPQPLANIQITNADQSTSNFLSYGLVDMMTWQGLGDVINKWRVSSLDLEAIPAMAGANLASYLELPFTYCWSPALVPKPFDWPSHIDIDNFFRAGSRPIYIGFGSIVMEDVTKMTQIILDAVRLCGVRAIVSEGWSKLGSGIGSSEDVLFIGDCPHEWLFKHVSAVIHHGGAGTTACGILNGRPTGIVPFFGDQPFWANMVAAAGAGPRPLDHKTLDSDVLARAITILLSPDTIRAAEDLSRRMRHENGDKEATKSFHRNLPVDDMNCDMIPRHPAVWYWKRGKRTLKLSHQAASILIENNKMEASALSLYKSKPIVIENRRWDPITGTFSAAFEGFVDVGKAMGSLIDSPMKEYRKAMTKEQSEANPNKERSPGLSAAGAAGKAVGKSFGKVGMTVAKTAVDLPLAFADGLHNVPALYGDKPRDHGPVTGWKSGGVVGVKNFGMGMYDGYSGLFTQPYKGAKEGGAKGFVKGIGKGTAGFLTKNGSAVFGVVAYPALGAYRSLKNSTESGTQGEILKAQRLHMAWLAKAETRDPDDIDRVLRLFDQQWLAVEA